VISQILLAGNHDFNMTPDFVIEHKENVTSVKLPNRVKYGQHVNGTVLLIPIGWLDGTLIISVFIITLKLHQTYNNATGFIHIR
jgi:hypothetical protein